MNIDTLQLSDYTLTALAYVVMGLVFLFLTYTITRRIPSPYGWMIWCVFFTCLFAPTITSGEHPKLAPAIVGVLFTVMSKDYSQVFAAITPLLWTCGLLFSMGFLVSVIKQDQTAPNK